MEDCLKRLLTDKKEEKRSGGLDLLLRLSKREEKAAFFARETACGFGFYNPNAKEEVKLPAPRTKTLQQYVILPVESIIEKLKKLDALIDAHKDDEYRTVGGETELIGNMLCKMKQGAERLENYPLEEELRDFYKTQIGGYGVLLQLEAVMAWDDCDLLENSHPFYEAVFGKQSFARKPFSLKYAPQILLQGK